MGYTNNMNYSANSFGAGGGVNNGSNAGMNNRGNAATNTIPSFSDLMHTIAVPAYIDNTNVINHINSNNSNSVNSSPVPHAHNTQSPVIQTQSYSAPRVQYMLAPLGGVYGTNAMQNAHQSWNGHATLPSVSDIIPSNDMCFREYAVGMSSGSGSGSGSVSSVSSVSSINNINSISSGGNSGVQLPSMHSLATDMEKEIYAPANYSNTEKPISTGHNPKSRKTNHTPKKNGKLKVSNKTRKYVCEVCTRENGEVKAFTTSGHLARHKRIHSGEKNFACTFPGCPQRFSRRDNRNQHYKTHEKKGAQERSELYMKV